VGWLGRGQTQPFVACSNADWGCTLNRPSGDLLPALYIANLGDENSRTFRLLAAIHARAFVRPVV